MREQRAGCRLGWMPAWVAAALVLCAARPALAQAVYDIGCGTTTPVITGGVGASYTDCAAFLNTITVTINFGQVSPANSNTIVKAVVPVAIRSTDHYQVQARVTATVSGDANAVQLSDVGLGLQNWRTLADHRTCTGQHVFVAPYWTDPSAIVDLLSGRASYAAGASLATPPLNVYTRVLYGPRLSRRRRSLNDNTSDGYQFDLILTIVPQFYTVGSFSATLTLMIDAGVNVTC
jgi:hypothetical protein